VEQRVLRVVQPLWVLVLLEQQVLRALPVPLEQPVRVAHWDLFSRLLLLLPRLLLVAHRLLLL